MTPELLSPAGNFEKLCAALRYGADAVYLAGQMFGMRAGADCFDNDGLKKAVQYCHAHGKKVYLALNTMPHPNEYPCLENYLRELEPVPFDAYIVADLGVMSKVKEISPEREIHISTQASVVSADTALMYYKLGARRVVLSRELTLDEIKKIRSQIPEDLELEVFIHGAMCVSYSGRCLISNYFTNRDANRGACAQPCRWVYAITEPSRRDMPLGIEQNSQGTFLFGSKDLCMIEHIPQLLDSKVKSFKIEGRMKSVYYAAVTANTYRMAMDAYLRDGDNYRFDPAWRTELESVSHRQYDTGFFFDRPMDDAKIASDSGYIKPVSYIGDCISYDADSRLACFVQKNKLCVGQTAQILSPGYTGRQFTVEKMFDKDMQPISDCPHPFMKFFIKMPFEISPGDILRA